MQRESAGSPTTATILLMGIALILAAIVAAMLLNTLSFQYLFAPIPAIFIIKDIASTDEITGKPNYDSRVILLHTGILPYQNNNLKAQFYKNGVQVNANIATLNGHDFISTSHMGVQWMGGMGCSGATWTPGEMVCIDFSDGTFRPGDTVQVDIIDKSTIQILSRHSFRM
jgi:hypothetical protein